MALVDKLKNPGKKYHEKTGPVWEGPEGTGPQGGISQSMLGRFLSCRDRFKVSVFDGWRAKEGFSPALEYGNLFHRAEEAWRHGLTDREASVRTDRNSWEAALEAHCRSLADKFPMDREKVSHWYHMCLDQFPRYLDYWAANPAGVKRKILESEQSFDIPYVLPYSKRTVRLRGKRDGVDYIEVPKSPGETGIYLQENKTKSTVDQTKITRQLSFDLQTMIYLIGLRESVCPTCRGKWTAEKAKALDESPKTCPNCGGDYLKPEVPVRDWNNSDPIFATGIPVQGVRYNVVKRSAHKSPESMVKKLEEDVADNRGGEWFGRWLVDVSDEDIETFKRTCLDPVLEQLCLWWDVITGTLRHVNAFTLRDIIHWRHPHGVYNTVDETGGSDVDEYLTSGSTVGLERVTDLFPELSEV